MRKRIALLFAAVTMALTMSLGGLHLPRLRQRPVRTRAATYRRGSSACVRAVVWSRIRPRTPRAMPRRGSNRKDARTKEMAWGLLGPWPFLQACGRSVLRSSWDKTTKAFLPRLLLEWFIVERAAPPFGSVRKGCGTYVRVASCNRLRREKSVQV